MDYFEQTKKLEKTIENKIGDPNFFQELIEKIASIGDEYELTMSEIGDIHELFDKVLNKKISNEDFLEELFGKLRVSEEEKLSLATLYEEILDLIKEIEKKSQELEREEKQLQ